MKRWIPLSAVVLLVVAALWLSGYLGGHTAATEQTVAEHAPPRAAQALSSETAAIAAETTSAIESAAGDAGAQAPVVVATRAYDPGKPLAWNNHPYMAFADDPDPRIQSVVEAARSGAHPERLHPDARPKRFDPAQWREQPDAYLAVVEPGRIFDTAVANSGAPSLKIVGRSGSTIASGHTFTCTVQAVPHAPVSWLAIQGGVFTESRLGAMTTRADAQGLATATFYASPGVIDLASVLAGSPMCTGRVEFTIMITDPNESAQ